MIETGGRVLPRMVEGSPLVLARRSPDNWKLWLLVDQPAADADIDPTRVVEVDAGARRSGRSR
ncbi:MAG: hypothetical protein U0360_06825 [Dehalococcoidia bacterium]